MLLKVMLKQDILQMTINKITPTLRTIKGEPLSWAEMDNNFNSSAITVNSLIDLAGVIITNPNALDYWYSAYADALNTTAYLNWVGDSLTFGTMEESNSSVIDNVLREPISAVGQLSKLFAKEFQATVSGSITPYYTGLDARVIRSAGITQGATSGPLGMVGRSGTNGSYVEFLVPQATNIDILFYNNNSTPNTGTFDYQVDGGIVVSVPLSAPFASNKVVSINGLPSNAHTLRLTRNDISNQNYWQGVRYHNGFGVCVSRYGRPGWTSSDALGIGTLNAGADANGQARLALGVHAGNPALTIIALGQNDMTNQFTQGTNPQKYRENLVKMIESSTNSVLLLSTPNQTSNLTPTGGEPLEAYWQICNQLAQEYSNVCHVKLADIFTPNGDATRSVQLGYYAGGSSIHQSRKGYGAWAKLIHQILTAKTYPVQI